MPRSKDVHLNENGDLELGVNGDIKCVYDDDVMVDGIIFRLKTYAGDYVLEPECGASLEDFVGGNNTQTLGDRIKERVVHALTKDGFVQATSLQVDVIPMSASEITIVIQVIASKNTFTVGSSLDLMTGRLRVVS